MSGRYIARGSCLAARKLGGEMVILSAEDSHLFILNEIGTLLWEAADGKTPLSEIVAGMVCAQFEVEPATALQDAEEFVEALMQHKILLVADHPLEAGAGRSTPPPEL